MVWKKILLYSELLELLQNLRTGHRLLPPASPSLFLCSAARCPSPAFPPAASCPLAAVPAPPGPSSPARRSPAPDGSSSHGHVAPLPARVPLFGFGTCPVNFFLLFPHAHPHSCSFSFSARLLHRSSSVHHRQPPPPLLLSNFVLHQHRRILLPLPDPPFFLLPCARSPEHRASDFTPRRRPVSSRTEVPPLLPRQEHHQHHISTPKLLDQFPFTFLHSGRQNTVAALGKLPRRLYPLWNCRLRASLLRFQPPPSPQ
jgi:hypothetical protein